MSPSDALQTILRSFHRYYDVQEECVEPPFDAEAAFHSHDEQFFLVKSAKLSEAESHEYIFFAARDSLSPEEVQALGQTAWERGTGRARPHSSHRSTDVTLVLIAETISPEAKACLEKSKYYQSYRFTFHGWSHYRAIALETSTNTLICNRRGRELRKLFRDILKLS